MKKITLVLSLLCAVLFSGCVNKVEKAHAAYDRGIELIYNTANFAEAEKQFSEVIK